MQRYKIKLLVIKGLFSGGAVVKNLPADRGDAIPSQGWEDLLEKEMTTHFSILAWEIPWTEEPWWAPVHGVAKVGHDLATKTIKPCKHNQRTYLLWPQGDHLHIYREML